MKPEAFRQKITAFCRANSLFSAGDRVLAGVSGGADSMALLSYLLSRSDLTVTAVHIHHGIRGEEADGDAALVENFCAGHGVSFRRVDVDVPAEAADRGLSLETAGRLIRKEIFEALMKELGCTKTALAHHADDQAETLLMHLCRGTGLKGAAGIRPACGGSVHPLLCVSKAEILEYCGREGIPYRTDSTNLSTEYTRNKIRMEILPQLDRIYPGAPAHLAAFTRDAAEWVDFADSLAEDAMEKTVCRKEKNGRDAYVIDLSGFNTKHPLIQGEILRRVLIMAAGTPVDIERRHIDMIRERLGESGTTWDIALPYDLTCMRRYDRLIFIKKDSFRPFTGCYPVSGTRRFYDCAARLSIEMELTQKKPIKNQDSLKNINEIIIDYGKIKNSFFIRGRRPGDYLFLGRGGGRKKLKKFLIDRKIDRERRDELVLLAGGSEVIWIPGIYFNQFYRPEDQTKIFMKIRLEKINEF